MLCGVVVLSFCVAYMSSPADTSSNLICPTWCCRDVDIQGVIPAGYAFDQAIVNFYPEGADVSRCTLRYLLARLFLLIKGSWCSAQVVKAFGCMWTGQILMTLGEQWNWRVVSSCTPSMATEDLASKGHHRRVQPGCCGCDDLNFHRRCTT